MLIQTIKNPITHLALICSLLFSIEGLRAKPVPAPKGKSPKPSAPKYAPQNKILTQTQIGQLIARVAPHLDKTTLKTYARGIRRAGLKYGIDPKILIAIAQRESSFRREVPEGAAGEIGICQIRKMWLNNPQFMAEFKKVKESDLKDPNKSFRYAAWILQEIKGRMELRNLPYWSYYNSVQFSARKRYADTVQETLEVLNQRMPASLSKAAGKNSKPLAAKKTSLKRDKKKPTKPIVPEFQSQAPTPTQAPFGEFRQARRIGPVG